MAPSEIFNGDNHPTLAGSLKKYFTTGELSDMKIQCGDHVYAVHRLIVCGHSSVFTNAMKEEYNFKEARTGIIELDDDHPVTVQAMLEFMYTAGYDDTGFGGSLKERVLLHIDVYSAADKYAIGGLRKHAMQSIEKIIDGRDWKVSKESLCHIVATAYEKTPDNDKMLRMLIVRIVSKDLEELVHDTEFLDTVGHVEGFTATLVKGLVLRNKMLEAATGDTPHFFCDGCKKTVRMWLVWDDVSSDGGSRRSKTHCPVCGKGFTNSHWESNEMITVLDI